MSNRPRTEQKLTPPTAEEWRLRNREARAKKRQELAEQIADRVTNTQMNTVQSISNRIYDIAKDIKLIKASYSYPDAKREKVSKQIIELQNHIHELQTYLVRIEETAIGMHD
jgi:DNA repair ATPase RecN